MTPPPKVLGCPNPPIFPPSWMRRCRRCCGAMRGRGGHPLPPPGIPLNPDLRGPSPPQPPSARPKVLIGGVSWGWGAILGFGEHLRFPGVLAVWGGFWG